MEKFMYLFRGGIDSATSQTPEAKAILQKWMQWMGMLSKNGTMVAGEPLQKESRKVSGTNKMVTGSSHDEDKEMVGGYLIINAKDMDHAVEISKGCPILEVGGNVEVRQIQKMPV